MHERSTAQPIEKPIPIGRVEHGIKRIPRTRRFRPMGHAEQVQVMVSEHGYRTIAEVLHETQAMQRLWPAIHQIPDKPKPVLGRTEPDRLQQPFQGLEASLEIAYRVGGHCGNEKGRS
jgi:hypothetical protein